ncbi:hypothetical protein LCGC14_3167720, partial [marine sediment metagenome]
MSATSQLTDFSDLYTDLQNRVRVTTGVTATANQAKRYINIALHDMHVGFGEKFYWAERSAQLITHAQYTTGTVDVTQGSVTLTGNSTAWNTNNAFGVANMQVGGKFKVGGSTVYEIATVTGDTAATLTTKYISDTESAASYTYFEDEYALDSDFLRPVDLQSFSDAAEIILISPHEFRRRYPRNNIPGRERVATLITKDPSGDVNLRRRVRFFKPSSETRIIPYSFITNKLAVSSAGVLATNLSADTDEPTVPLSYRHAIVMHALWHWYRDKKDDQRSKEVAAEWAGLMERIIGDTEIGSARPQIRPRVSGYAGRARRTQV